MHVGQAVHEVEIERGLGQELNLSALATIGHKHKCDLYKTRGGLIAFRER